MTEEAMDVGAEGLEGGDDIIGAVDNAPAGTVPEGSSPGMAASAPSGAEKAPAAPRDASDDLADVLQNMLDEESGKTKPAPKEAPDVLSKLLDGLDPKSGAGQRIQELVGRAKGAEEARVAAEQQMAEIQRYAQGLHQQAGQQIAQIQQAAAQQIQALQTQVATLSGKLEVLGKPPAEREMDPAERLKQEWVKAAEDRYNELLKPMQERLDTFEKAAKQREEQARLEQDSQAIIADANSAVSKIVLNGMPEATVKDMTQPGAGSLSGLVLATMLHSNCSAEQAAKSVRNTLLRFSVGIARAKATGLKEAAKKAAEVPSAPGKRRTSSNGQSIASLDQIRKMGFQDELDPAYMSTLG